MGSGVGATLGGGVGRTLGSGVGATEGAATTCVGCGCGGWLRLVNETKPITAAVAIDATAATGFQLNDFRGGSGATVGALTMRVGLTAALEGAVWYEE